MNKILTCVTPLISVSTPAISNYGKACTLNIDCRYLISQCVSGVFLCMIRYNYVGGTYACIIGKMQKYFMKISN